MEGGFYAATTDHYQIAEWIMERGREKHGVAFATGAISGVIVIDADDAEAAERMRAKYGEPTVLSAHSYKGGAHWYFRHPRRGKVTSANVGPGLDRKGDGGYVLAPPSKGKTWTNGIPDIASLPVLPEEFWSKDREAAPGEREIPDGQKGGAVDAIAARIDTIKGGSRHEHMLALCRVLLDRGVSIVDAEDILTATWERYGGELAERAPSEIPNALATTQARIENDAPAKGVPYLEEATPELFEELRTVFGWVEKIIGATDEERREQAARAWETCEDLAKRRDITGDLVDVLRRRGVAGESKLIRLVYLALNSCRLDKMVNVALKGPSSSGKSYIAEKILEMFPESTFYALTSMSKRRSST